MKTRKIELSEPKPEWKSIFKMEKDILSRVFEGAILSIHHIGSTAIPNIKAKPIVDVLIEAKNISKIDTFDPNMVAAGYEIKGENGIKGRRFYLKEIDGARVSHVHIFQAGNPEIKRHLAFRNALVLNPDLAKEYEAIKMYALEKSEAIPEKYQELKSEFIGRITAQAVNDKTSDAGGHLIGNNIMLRRFCHNI